MKSRLGNFSLLFVLGSTFTMTTGFGQVITWTNINAQTYPGGNFGRSTNWSGNNGAGGTTPISGAICTFDGTVSGNLTVFSQDGINGIGGGLPIGGDFGASGIFLKLTSTQIGSLNFICGTGVTASVGMGLSSIQVDSGAGQLVLGDNSTRQLVTTLRPSASLHPFINNSAYPVVINPNFQIQNGGGTAGHVIDFQGTGDWAITNALRFNNNAPGGNLQWDGTGTTLWASTGESGTSGSNLFNSALGTVTINAGTVIVKSAGLLPTNPGANTIQHNGTLLKFDQANQSDTIGRVISGASTIQVSAGTNVFTSGASTFSGNLNLTGGELIASANENAGVSGPLGQGGAISFNGGTLGYSPNNAFDYSSRFDTSAGQTYRIDTARQIASFGTGLGGSGNSLIKLGGGTLMLAGTSSYPGPTTISGGKLVFQGSKTGTGNITVADSAALGITDSGNQITPGTLTLGTGGGVTLEFDNITSTTTAPLAPATLSSAGIVTININSGTFTTIGQSFPLFSWSSGSAPAVSLATVSGAQGTLSTNGNSIQFNVTSVPLIWTGVNSGNWTGPNNWIQSGTPTTYSDPSFVVFDDTASGATSVIVDAAVHPASVTVNNSTKSYSFTSSGGNNIAGSTGLTRSGSGTLTLSGGANTYTGVTTLSGGTLSVGSLANGGSPSDIGAANSDVTNLVLNGGTLLYTGVGVSLDRLFTLANGSGTIDNEGSGPLVFNNPGAIGLSGNGPRTLTLAGAGTTSNTLAAAIKDSNSGSTSLNKNGTGIWVLTGTNSYSGVTTVANGLLQIGAGGSVGALGSGSVTNNGAIDFNRTGTLTVSGAISGTGSVTNDGSGTVILANTNSYQGGTTINAGTLQVGNGSTSGGSLYVIGPIHNNSLLIFNSPGGSSIYVGTGLIDGPGNVIVRGSGNLVKAVGANTYTGWTLIDTNATFQPCEGNQGQLLSSVVTNFGTLKLVRQDLGVFGYSNNIVGTGRVLKDQNASNDNDVTLAGTNSYTGGTIIAGGGIVLGDGLTPVAGTIVGNVIFTNNAFQDVPRSLTFNRPDDVTFTGNITGPGGTLTGGTVANAGSVVKNQSSTLTLTANNTYLGGTIINAGTVSVGNGGASGAIGSGPVNNNGLLIFNRSGSLTVTGAVSGAGALVQNGTSTTTLLSTNNFWTGNTTISNGTLIYASAVASGGTVTMGGDLNLEGGTLIVGGISTATKMNVGGAMHLDSGTVVASLNKGLSPSFSNTTFTVAGLISCSGGTLKVLNAGPLPVPGDKFTIFSAPVTGGGGITIVSPGMTLANNLALDGSVTVTSVQPAPNITATLSGTALNLSWPSSWTGGVHLQAQTNALNRGVSGNWVTIPNTDLNNTFSSSLSKSNVSVFYRLTMP